jgi:methyltransferase
MTPMATSLALYVPFVAAVGLGRLIEMSISRRRQRALADRGIAKITQPNFRWMVLLHGGVLAAAPLEVWWFDRPLIPTLAISMIALFVFASALRWWVIRTLAGHWNVQVMDSLALGVVTDGPFRWIRHPNYLAVFLELLAIPLIHAAWVTASAGAIAHVGVLRGRIAAEERMLLTHPAYRVAMGDKPRFVPGFF